MSRETFAISEIVLFQELENLNRHLPITIGYAKTKMNELRILNASIDVVHLVQQVSENYTPI